LKNLSGAKSLGIAKIINFLPKETTVLRQRQFRAGAKQLPIHLQIFCTNDLHIAARPANQYRLLM